MRFQLPPPTADAALRRAVAALAELPGVAAVRAHRILWLREREPGMLRDNPAGVLAGPVGESVLPGHPAVRVGHTYLEIALRPGVTDNAARDATEALMLTQGLPNAVGWQDWGVAVHSGWQLELEGEPAESELRRVLQRDLVNPLLHTVSVASGAALQATGWFDPPRLGVPGAASPAELQLFPLEFSALDAVNRERGMALSADEIHAIIRHFESVADSRRALGWGGAITEVELECIAQTWSEHCKHKIFAAQIDYSEVSGDFPALGAQRINSLYKTYIQQPTRELWDCGYLVSVFSDNAGVVDFDSRLNVCVKAETHNSPSALDPYGGAMTGVLGVHRDIMGTGLGALPIANLEVSCLSHAGLFPDADDARRPQGLKDPAVIFRGVHRGAAEAARGSGVPTVNSGLRFASEYGGKPLVFVGSVGVMPKEVAGRDSAHKEIRAGDLIVVAGGRVGRDGVHGATFSSLALEDEVAPNTVQIGDPLTQRRLMAFTLAARDRGWIRAVTDNGAGGLSSSIGEMAELSGGARLDLARHAVKYPGLQYWEILVSESQERMSYAVAPEHGADFVALARSMGVEAWVLGEFTDTGCFEVRHGDVEVARLALDFLHDGVPVMTLQAHFDGPVAYRPYYRRHPRQPLELSPRALPGVLRAVLAHPNVASHQFLQAQDTGGQALRQAPWVGAPGTPADATVLDLAAWGGDADNALALGHGLCPQFSHFDTWLMAQRAVDMAVRKVVAVGADPARIALLDNFCWPDPLEHADNPDAQHKLAQLVRACAALADAAHAFRAPFVSGKDSMKNDYSGSTLAGDPVRISVAPTLLVTAIAQNAQAGTTVSPEFKRAGDRVYLVGAAGRSLHGSVCADLFEAPESEPEYPDLHANAALYRALHAAMRQRLLASCRAVQAGGLLVAAVQACFGRRVGLTLEASQADWPQWFSETGSAFVVSVQEEQAPAFERALQGQAQLLGRTQQAFALDFNAGDTRLSMGLAPLLDAWSTSLKAVYDA